METFTLILLLFSSLILIFAFGKLIGHIFGLDDYLNSIPHHDMN